MTGNIRIFFSKTGRAVYISHLDLYRVFQRAIKRSRLPVWETEGFNPHVYITFALPLALGTEGLCESMDTRLTEELDPEEICERLNKALPRDIRVLSAGEQIMKAALIDRSEYEALYTCDESVLDEFLAQPQINTEKKTKRGVTQVDIKPYLIIYERRPGFLRFSLPSGNEFNLNAGLFFDTFESFWGSEMDSLNIKRTKIYCKNGEIFR